MSSTSWVGLEAKASIQPLLRGTIAMFEVIAPSTALRVETVGFGQPSGHKVK